MSHCVPTVVEKFANLEPHFLFCAVPQKNSLCKNVLAKLQDFPLWLGLSVGLRYATCEQEQPRPRLCALKRILQHKGAGNLWSLFSKWPWSTKDSFIYNSSIIRICISRILKKTKMVVNKHLIHFYYPIRLVLYQHLYSHVAYPGISPENSKHT